MSKTDALITAGQNRTMFNNIAACYDLLNTILSLGMDRGWRRKAVARLAPASGQQYLDLGAGTGDLTAEIARQNPAANTLACDPATAMLQLARHKIDNNAICVAADALQLPLADNTVDGVIAGFCVRNLIDRQRAFSEIRRVLRPQGAFVILELVTPGSAPMRCLHTIHNKCWLPLVAGVLSVGSAYSYLAKSIEHFSGQDQLMQELRDSGFSTCDAESLSGGVVTLIKAVC